MNDGLLRAWLRRVSTGALGRENAIRHGATVLADSSPWQLLDLVALAHAQRLKPAAERVRDAVGEHDRSFAGRPGDVQTQVVAAWAVALAVCGEKSSQSVVASLATACARFYGLSPRGPELPCLAAQRLAERSEAVRHREPLPRSNAPKSLDELSFQSSPQVTTAQLDQVVKATSNAMVAMTRSFNRISAAAQARVDAADEELDLLWWTVTCRRGGDGPAWHELGEAAPLLAGLDVAAMTRFATPLSSSGMLLDKALGDLRPLSVGAAVQAAAEHVEHAAEVRHPLLQLLTALSFAQAQDSGGWQAAARQAGIDLDGEHAGRDLAEQVLREELIWRLL